ncbi:MAG: exodeoxyribonuclease VII small subunit [Oscillospiraceae bacterium]|nr:exodeoxyribonuclease VII small subunit [Oscillospiraceae bacterium]
MAVKKKTFEEAMLRLEEIVNRLERGDAPLEESMSLFEEGTKLAASCSKQLDTAEQKVWKLSKGQDGTPVQTPMEGES